MKQRLAFVKMKQRLAFKMQLKAGQKETYG